jgi:hypothetical protein
MYLVLYVLKQADRQPACAHGVPLCALSSTIKTLATKRLPAAVGRAIEREILAAVCVGTIRFVQETAVRRWLRSQNEIPPK